MLTGIISSSEVAAEAEAPDTLAFFVLDCKEGGGGFCKNSINIRAATPIKAH